MGKCFFQQVCVSCEESKWVRVCSNTVMSCEDSKRVRVYSNKIVFRVKRVGKYISLLTRLCFL